MDSLKEQTVLSRVIKNKNINSPWGLFRGWGLISQKYFWVRVNRVKGSVQNADCSTGPSPL